MTTVDLSCGCTLLGKCSTRATQDDGLCDECRPMTQIPPDDETVHQLHAAIGTTHVSMPTVTEVLSSPSP